MLEYPFGKKWSPEPGEPFEVADGVYWLRMPLPIELDHINLWLLKDSDERWTIVDTGYNHISCKNVWDQVFESFIDEKSVKQIVITHFHPDHIGLAAWLAHLCDAPIIISKGEFDHYHDIINREPKVFGEQVQQYATEIGFDDQEAIASISSFFGSSNKPEKERVLSKMCKFIAEGDELSINGRQWQIVMGNGHSPEHACLYCPELNTLISGDQAIARISSNISVYPSSPNANPLRDWLDSCIKLRDKFDSTLLVLASHQGPFKGIDLRMQTMIDDHHTDLNRLRRALVNKITTIDARKVLFDRELNPIQMVLATGEALANLNYLVAAKELQVTNEKGVLYYQKQP